MSLKNDLMSRGYVEIGTRGKCKYYVKAGEKYAVAIAVREGTEFEFPIIVENTVFANIGYPSIYVDDKTGKGMLVPCVQRGYGYKRIHNLICPVQTGMCVDHINHNRFFCAKSNLRYSTSLENSMNSQRRCEIYVYTDISKYTYALKVDAYEIDKITWLMGNGFEKTKKTSRKVTLVSNAIYDSKADCYLAYRDTAKVLYQGTGMERFVYDIENDFSETFNLLLDHYIFHDITKDEMRQMNLAYWRDTLDNAPIAIAI